MSRRVRNKREGKRKRETRDTVLGFSSFPSFSHTGGRRPDATLDRECSKQHGRPVTARRRRRPAPRPSSMYDDTRAVTRLTAPLCFYLPYAFTVRITAARVARRRRAERPRRRAPPRRGAQWQSAETAVPVASLRSEHTCRLPRSTYRTIYEPRRGGSLLLLWAEPRGRVPDSRLQASAYPKHDLNPHLSRTAKRRRSPTPPHSVARAST